MPLASQIELPERYRVTRHIASGGMASVWEVEDLLLGRVVAVKVLGAHYAADPSARERFQREARTAAQVSAHPNVVTIYDIGEHGDDAFLVMEYFSGGTVAARLKAAREEGEVVDRDTVLGWLREAAAGLDVAHEAGIVHRDVKPANLLLDAQGRLAVADFGIARLGSDTQMTQTGQVLGTAAYLSPEQATGEPATPASDRYALAVVAYELLSGERPFNAAAPAAQLLQHAEQPPPRASEAAARPAEGRRRRPQARAGEGSRRAAGDGDGSRRRARARALGRRRAGRHDAADGARGGGPGARARQAGARAGSQAGPARAGRGASAEPAPPPQPAPAPPRPARGRDGVPLAAVLAVAVVIVGVVVGLALRGADNNQQRAGNPSRTQTSGAEQKTTPAPAAPAEEPQAAGASQSSGDGSSSPSALNDRGFALINAGDYAGAVEPLRAAVQGYRDAGQTSELGYNFALYNLGVALNRSGNPAEAIPFLEERLLNPNQKGTVKRELAAAQAKLGGGKTTKAKDGRRRVAAVAGTHPDGQFRFDNPPPRRYPRSMAGGRWGVIAGIGLALLAGPVAARADAAATKRQATAPGHVVTPPPTLRRVQQGTALRLDPLRRDSSYRDTFLREFDQLTPENEMKMQTLQPRRGVFDFRAADEMVAFARKHDRRVHGHALVWGLQVPLWLIDHGLTENLNVTLPPLSVPDLPKPLGPPVNDLLTLLSGWTREELLGIMRGHIDTVMRHFGNDVAEWDVVNEPMAENGALANNVWRRFIGDDYVELALRAARAANPRAKLFINEYAVESSTAKRAGLLALVRDLKARGVPLDGVGLQYHTHIQGFHDEATLADTIRRFAALGVEVQITEMDVGTSLLAGSREQRLARQAEAYGAAARACNAVLACSAFTTWGITDRVSWLGASEMPLLFDAQYQPKPAYGAVRSSFAQRSARTARRARRMPRPAPSGRVSVRKTTRTS